MPTKADYIKKDDDVFYEGGKASKKDKKGKKNKKPAIRVSARLSRKANKAADDMSLEGVPLLTDSMELFDDLTKRNYFKTDLNIISMVVTYDSKFVIAICQTTDTEMRIRGFSLTSMEPVWNHKFFGHVDESLDAVGREVFLKGNIIEQNDAGNVFVVPYQDNGKFRVVFIEQKGNDGIIVDNLDVNKLLVIDNLSKPISGFREPLITCAVLPDENVFISAYHRIQRT